MREFKTVDRVFVKVNNNSQQIFNRYTYGLIFLTLYNLIYNLILGETSYVISYLKTLLIVIVLTILIGYVINIIYNRKSFKKAIIKDNLLSVGLILSYFLVDSNILLCFGSILITLIIKTYFKKINLSVVLFGILGIYIYKYFSGNLMTPLINLGRLGYIGSYNEIVKSYGSILDYLLGKIYLSPVILILIFGYLFYRKSIKYNLVITYNLTIFGFFLIFGLFNGMSIWYAFFQLACGNVIFFSIFCLSDYMMSPTIGEGQILYGFILGLLTVILRFIMPEVAVVVALIIGIFMVKWIDNFSIKLKYQDNIQKITIILGGIISILMFVVLSIIF